MRISAEKYYPATHQKIVPGDTAVGLDSDTIKPPGERSLRYSSGGVGTIAVGDVITGATGGTTATVAGVVLETGTFGAGTGQGVLYIDDQVGDFEAENLNLTGATTQANVATIAEDSVDISIFKDKHAQMALVTCEAQSAMFTLDGTIPTETGGTRVGHQLPAAQSIILETPDEIKNFQCVDFTAQSACYIKVTCYFLRIDAR